MKDSSSLNTGLSSTITMTDMKSGKEFKLKPSSKNNNGMQIVGMESAPQAIETGYKGPGTQPDSVYEASMSKWRFWLRKMVSRNLKEESRLIGSMQDRVRLPYLDIYFVNTSVLGTHTFFMIFLPMLYWFGCRDLAHGLVFVLSLGCYLVSFLKDLICSPRPYVPPVTRLTLGSHHLEYGFPSTHSTNSVSIALYIFSYIHNLYYSESPSILSSTMYQTSCVLLFIYVFSVVYGRLYTGMHSFTDCACGVLLGAFVWVLHVCWGREVVERIVSSGWAAPPILLLLTAFIINRHPQPIDDCPCFEDAVAFIAVLLGTTAGKWFIAQFGGLEEVLESSYMPGSQLETWSDVGMLAFFTVVKMVVGILIIFTWRILAKSILHFLLPPIFRFLSQLFTLPHRRFYTPATDYTSVPPEKGIHPIPSVMDLPSYLAVDATGMNIDAKFHPYKGLRNLDGNGSGWGEGLKARNASGSNIYGAEKVTRGKGYNNELEKNMSASNNGSISNEGNEEHEDAVKRYDADVITKVIVYAGIGFLSSEILPLMFSALGWGISPRAPV